MTIEHVNPQSHRPRSGFPSEGRQDSGTQTADKKSEHTSLTEGSGSHGVSDSVQKIKEGGKDSLEGTQELGQELWFEGRDRAKSAWSKVESYVAENPMRSVLWAAGIGAVLGMLRGRRG